jgi:23S rRNA pseudouridine1911/1915/1917 synthase
MPGERDIHLQVLPKDADLRLDIYLSEHLSDASRSAAARLLKSGAIRVNGRLVKPSYRLDGSERIEGRLPEPNHLVAAPEALPLEILYEDCDIIVLNKAAGMVVHPAPGHHTGTLVNALLYHCADLSGSGGDIRPGIVHRLDKDTSGVLLIAKNQVSQRRLSDQFKARETRKWYRAIVVGAPIGNTGRCEDPIGRHPSDRKRMSIHSRKGREALTLWKIRTRWLYFSELEMEIKTGRTHQIRVHLSALGHPVLGDASYGPTVAGIQKSGRWPGAEPAKARVQRQLLHAWRLIFIHPASGRRMTISAPLPDDYVSVQDYLHEYSPL